MIVFSFFLLLAILTLVVPAERTHCLARSRHEWLLDCAGLLMQGVVIPFLQMALVYRGLVILAPSLHSSVDIPGWASFALNFIGVDYLYYWNHRLLHQPRLWPMHMVHHGAKRLDFVVTSRNTLWTPFFIVYLWMNGLMIFLLKEPQWYVLGASLSAGLDLWRHTRFSPPVQSAFFRSLHRIFIFPIDHAWHHSTDVYNVNFGANLKLWDQLHGTLWEKEDSGQIPEVGAPHSLTLAQQVLWPFQKIKGGGS